jgi:hypothetical protein
MPLQNRVDPFGAIFSSTARGILMGNRGGALHNNERVIVRQFRSRRWITCLLKFKQRQRSVMSPGLYTELFFLDEAVAFAAGHRPCAECRRDRFNGFRNSWMHSCPTAGGGSTLASAMDVELHRARIDQRGGKVTYEEPLDSLPNGCFVRIDGSSFMVWDKKLLLWSPEGYVRADHRPNRMTVTVLTPEPIVRCLHHGYQPAIHESALALISDAFSAVGQEVHLNGQRLRPPH